MARKMLVMEDSLLTNDDEDGGGRCTGVLSNYNTTAIEDPEDPLIETREQEDDDEQCSLALKALLKEVNVGEESYKTPTKGKSSVAISIEIEVCANVEVSLPPPLLECLDYEEFESNWPEVIKKHELEDDEWLQGKLLGLKLGD
uniref:Uncharacterized protein n=1 Tax=Chenopodium quinoa TaxID=63459 RepID=A0A803MIR3_CHEQI